MSNIDVLVAEAMECPDPPTLDDPEYEWGERSPDGTWKGWYCLSGWVYWPPHYSTDLEAARKMENWVERMGPELIRAYTEALCGEVGYHFNWTNLKLLWNVAHATPEQRCHAFLKVCGVSLNQ